MKSNLKAPSGSFGRFGWFSWKGAAVALSVGVGAAVLAGCTGTLGAEGGVVYGHPVVYSEAAPVELAAYPRVYYRDGYAYLIDGSWYYPSATGWVIFREEPTELRTYRTRYYRSSPRYVPDRGYGSPRERPRRRYYSPR